VSGVIGRFRVDPSARRHGSDGRVVLGGAPRRLFRLGAPGAELLDRIGAGEVPAATAGRLALVDRLVTAGILHPDPSVGSGPLGPDDVTIVIPVRDRPDGVAALLASLRGTATYPARVIVVDDGSRSPGALEQVVDAVRNQVDGQLRAPRLDLVRRETSGGPAAARNTGLDLVDTPLVAFLDSDCTVGDGWLDRLLPLFGGGDVVLAAPRVRSRSAGIVPGVRSRPAGTVPGRAVLETYEKVASPLDLGRHRSPVAPGRPVSYVPSAALVGRTASLVALGGFDPTLDVGEDVDLVWRAVAEGSRVRYEPAAEVFHEPRPDLGGWLAQRFGYGRSAAALDRRHPGRVAPVVFSPWSAAVWVLAVAGAPLSAVGLAAFTAARLCRRLPDLPRGEVGRLALGGHLGAGRQLARASTRSGWPLAFLAAASGRRARRWVLAASVVSVTESWRNASDRGPMEIDPLRFAALALLDDMAYGAGVWAGCAQQRSFRALLPAASTSRDGG